MEHKETIHSVDYKMSKFGGVMSLYLVVSLIEGSSQATASCEVSGVEARESCTLYLLKDCEKTAAFQHNGDVNSTADTFDVDVYFKDGQPGFIITIEPPIDVAVSGFEVPVFFSTGHVCIHFNLSTELIQPLSQPVKITGHVYAVNNKDTFVMRAFAITQSLSLIPYEERYVRTPPSLDEDKRGLSAYWMPAIVYYNNSKNHSVWVRFTEPNQDFHFTSFVVKLIRHMDGEKRTPNDITSEITSRYEYTFTNVKAGNYSLMVSPYNPYNPEPHVKGRCKCFDGDGCRTCILTETETFEVFDIDEHGSSPAFLQRTANIPSPTTNRSDSYDFSESAGNPSFQEQQTTSDTSISGVAVDDKRGLLTIVIPSVISFGIAILTGFFCLKAIRGKECCPMRRNKRKENSCENLNEQDYASFKDEKAPRDVVLVNPKLSTTNDYTSCYDIGWLEPKYPEKRMEREFGFQCGNFILDPDDYSIFSPSIAPARTILEIDLENNIMSESANMKRPMTDSFDSAVIVDQVISDKIYSEIVTHTNVTSVGPENMHFVSPEPSEVDDIISQYQSEQMTEINRRYMTILESFHQKDEVDTNLVESLHVREQKDSVELKTTDDFNATVKNEENQVQLTDSEHVGLEIILQRENGVKARDFKNDIEHSPHLNVGSEFEDSYYACDTGFCSETIDPYDSVSFTGISI